jgi:acyl-coenzyme A thioesterase PaaI-like protein
MGRAALKKERHHLLLEKLKQDPFLKDEELARVCNVSIATIRFDRAELGIAEYRERVKNVAKDGFHHQKTRSTGELLDLNLYHDGISVLTVDEGMLFPGTDIVKSQYIYAFAENLALSVIDAKAALVKVANVKYIKEAHSTERLVAKSEVIRVKEKEYIVHVRITVRMTEVFRGKFSLLVQDQVREKE